MTFGEYLACAIVALACTLGWFRNWLRNWTLVALAGSFLIVHAVWVVTGEAPFLLNVGCDYLVVLTIFLKVDIICVPFGGLWANCSHCWGRVPIADRIVLGLFAPAWAAAFFPFGDASRYWIMWACGVAQLLAVVGSEISAGRRSRRREKVEEPSSGPFAREGLALPFPLSRALVP